MSKRKQHENTPAEPLNGAAENPPAEIVADAPEESAPVESAPVKDEPQPAARSYALPVAIVALLGAVGVGVGGYFVWHEVQRLGVWQQQVLGQIDSRSQSLDQRLENFKDRLDADLATTDRGRRELEDAQRKLATALEGQENSLTVLRAQMGRSQNDWTLAEIQYLLQMANQRVQLQRDTVTAVAALESADQRLQELADPGFNAVREQIAQEIAALKAVALPDRPGIALALNTLSGRVAELPLESAQPLPEFQPENTSEAADAGFTVEDWKRLPALIWQELRNLVVVRRNDEPVGPMLAPDQQYFLRQNLDLKLHAARLAALQSDHENYRASLTGADAWLAEYFAADDARVVAMRGELQRLAAIDVRPSLPDVSASLRQLRQRMRLSDLATPAPAKKAPNKTAAPAPAAPPAGDGAATEEAAP